MKIIISEEQLNNIKKLLEATEDDVNLSSFKFKDSLNDKIWKGEKLNYKVRRKLLKIADDFLDFINIDSKYCSDILFLGSLANYNWSRYSDIDLHILIDFKKINPDVELVSEYFDAKRKEWNLAHESLKIYNFPIEVYVQNIDEDNKSTASYSIENNKWILKPDIDTTTIKFNEVKIKQKASDLMSRIDALKEKLKSNKNIDSIEIVGKESVKLYNEIKRIRKNGLNSGKGEFSDSNIIFKVLRRSGHIKDLIDIKQETYDKINTIK